MAEPKAPQDGGFTIIRDPTLYFSLLIALAALVMFWISRAPTIYSGKLPFIGDNVPLKLTAVYFIVLGPLAVMLATAALWFETTRLDFTASTPADRQKKRGNAVALVVLLALVLLFTSMLSVQYFLILAPSELCPSRPHFDFLWHNLDGHTRINHCMSGTEEINATAPYYMEPQVVQAWGHVITPVLTLVCLYQTWTTWRRKLAA